MVLAAAAVAFLLAAPTRAAPAVVLAAAAVAFLLAAPTRAAPVMGRGCRWLPSTSCTEYWPERRGAPVGTSGGCAPFPYR